MLGLGRASILSQKSLLAQSKSGGGVLGGRRLTGFHIQEVTAPPLFILFCLEATFPRVPRGQTNVTEQKNTTFLILICFGGDF